MKKITQCIWGSTNCNSEEEWLAAIKRRPLICRSYKYFEMSHLGKTASDHGRVINHSRRRTRKEKMALWYFRNNYSHKRGNEWSYKLGLNRTLRRTVYKTLCYSLKLPSSDIACSSPTITHGHKNMYAKYQILLINSTLNDSGLLLLMWYYYSSSTATS